ncbi:MAG: alanine racemase [Opitutales bacterium]
MEFASRYLRSSVQIDLCALERNLKRIKDFLINEKKYIAFVAADAFGVGLSAAVARLMESGVDAFAVTNLSEALQVRQVGLGWQIIVMTSSILGEENLYFENNITANLATLEEAKRFEEIGKTLNKRLSVNMRLPLLKPSIPDRNEAKKLFGFLINEAKFLDLNSLCAVGTGSGTKEKNLELDLEFLEEISIACQEKSIEMSLHHSDIFEYKNLPKNMTSSIRIGLVLFGVCPENNSILNAFKPEQVISFKTAISQIKELPKGYNIGYNNSYQLKKDAKVALISAGYADGLSRKIQDKYKVLLRGKYVSIMGIVSMDQACIDVSDIEEVKEGDEVVLIGKSGKEEIRIEDYCDSMAIVAGQALSSITKRVPRYYKTLEY